MPKIDIVRCEHDVICVSISNNLYYIDMSDKSDVKIYDSNIKRVTTYMPDYWIYEISKGVLTLNSLFCSMKAYQSGYIQGLESSSVNAAKTSAKLLSRFINDSEFIKICWVEIFPYNHVKQSVSRLLSDSSLYLKDPKETNKIISRFEKRAIDNNDLQMVESIKRVRAELDVHPVNYDMCSLFEALFLTTDSIDELSSNIDVIKSKRTAS